LCPGGEGAEGERVNSEGGGGEGNEREREREREGDAVPWMLLLKKALQPSQDHTP